VLHIKPGHSIGPLRLGMPQEELEQVLLGLWKELGLAAEPLGRKPEAAPLEERGVRYWSARGEAVVLLIYRDGRAVDISISRGFADFTKVEVYGMDVFRSEAADVVARASRETNSRDMRTDAFEYIFSGLGLRLWREHLESPEDDTSPSKFDFAAVMNCGR